MDDPHEQHAIEIPLSFPPPPRHTPNQCRACEINSGVEHGAGNTDDGPESDADSPGDARSGLLGVFCLCGALTAQTQTHPILARGTANGRASCGRTGRAAALEAAADSRGRTARPGGQALRRRRGGGRTRSRGGVAQVGISSSPLKAMCKRASDVARSAETFQRSGSTQQH